MRGDSLRQVYSRYKSNIQSTNVLDSHRMTRC